MTRPSISCPEWYVVLLSLVVIVLVCHIPFFEALDKVDGVVTVLGQNQPPFQNSLNINTGPLDQARHQ